MEGIEAGVLREKLEIDELIEQTKKVNYKIADKPNNTIIFKVEIGMQIILDPNIKLMCRFR